MGITKSKIEGLDKIQEMLKEYREGGALELKHYREIGTVEECREAMKIHNKAYSHQLAYYDHNGHRYNGQVRFTEGIGNHDGQGNSLTLR